MTADPHDLRKADIEDALISSAESKAQVAMFGKACYEGHPDFKKRRWAVRPLPWSQLSEKEQVNWVRRAQAVLAEAKRVGWMFPV